MTINWISFVLGLVGGALAELLKWYQLKESPNLPEYARKPMYWVLTGLMILAGGVLVVVYGVTPSNPLLALNIGLSAPLLLKGLAASVPVRTTTAPAAPAGVGGPIPSFDPTTSRATQPSPLNFIAGR